MRRGWRRRWRRELALLLPVSGSSRFVLFETVPQSGFCLRGGWGYRGFDTGRVWGGSVGGSGGGISHTLKER